MKIGRKSFITLGLVALLAGCSDKPHEYGEQRPDVGSLHPDDRDLQSKDVIEASDKMAMDLLALPELADSRTQWTVVVTGMENATSDRHHQQYDVFINRLKTNVAQQGHGRVRLIENRDRYRDLQSRELEGDGRHNPGTPGVQPQFALHGQVSDLPNRATNYFLFEFDLTDLRSREIVWANKYEVKVQR
jgi:hypothetical protein